MGISIQVSGEATYAVDKKQFLITADSLKQGRTAPNSAVSFKGEDVQWLAQFSVVTDAGEFIWDVHYPIGESGVGEVTSELSSFPSVKDVTDRMIFTAVEVDDDLAEPVGE